MTRRVRVSIVLVCGKCGNRNYKSTKPPGQTLNPIRKYCKFCGCHTLHHESS